jgi:hypothetical protein
MFLGRRTAHFITDDFDEAWGKTEAIQANQLHGWMGHSEARPYQKTRTQFMTNDFHEAVIALGSAVCYPPDWCQCVRSRYARYW